MISYLLIFILLELFIIANKIMKEGLRNENSFIIDRNWEKVNPSSDLTVSIDQTKEFLKLLV